MRKRILATIVAVATLAVLALYDHSGVLVDGNGPPTADPIVAEALTGVVNEGIVEGDLVAALPIRIGDNGPEFVVRVTESAGESHHRVRRDLGMLALAAVAIIAAAALAGILLARRLSRPSEDLRDWTGSLGEAERVPPPHSGIDELDTLGSALASADERIRELLERERAFSSHVAHQLRTPVAAMRIAVEAELDRPRDDHREVLIESLGALDRLESTIGSMLALARSDPRELIECEVSSVVTDHSARWEPRYASVGRSIRHRGSPVWARVDITVIDHVLDVLLDNALNYGAGTVTVSTNTRSESIEIDVADEGCGRATDPFGEQRSDSGHGIGLRLARTLAELAAGTLGLASTSPTVFRLTLPLRR